GEQAEILQHGEDVDVVVAKTHPEADGRHLEDMRQRMHLVMASEVRLLLADDRQIPFLADLEHPVRNPLLVLPGPDLAGELAEVDLRVEIGGEVAAMAAG